MATPFTVRVDEASLQDLRDRLGRTRLPDQLEDAGWSYGTELRTLGELVEYWRTEFDWRAQEEYLNSFTHFTMKANGINVHFVHEPSSHPDAIPLVLLHGWPGSFFEFHKVIKLLKNLDAASDNEEVVAPHFHIVAPSLPGYAFSSHPTKSGFDVVEMARTVNELMVNLGYTAYAAQGGDWGAVICKALGSRHSANCKAIHVNMCLAGPYLLNPLHWCQLATILLASFTGLRVPLFLSDAEIRNFLDTYKWMDEGSGYFRIQGTKPQTLSYGLNDSPAGLLAWILEKFREWSDCGGDVLSSFTKDEILTNVCLYWFTQSVSSSVRLYYETMHSDGSKRLLMPGLGRSSYVPVPTAVALFPKELIKPPKAWAQAEYNLKRWTVFGYGGHFAALEVPDLLVEDMSNFFAGQAKFH